MADIKDSTDTFSDYVLVIESNPDEMFTLSEALRKRGGLRVMGFMASDTAIESMEKDLPDLLIADVYSTADKGFAIIDATRCGERTKEMKVIALVSEDAGSAALEVGADAILKKPVDIEALLAMVDTLLGR